MLKMKKMPPFRRICNPTELNISICNAENEKDALEQLALQMPIFTSSGLQIPPNPKGCTGLLGTVPIDYFPYTPSSPVSFAWSRG